MKRIESKGQFSINLMFGLGIIIFSILAYSFLKPMFNHQYLQLLDLGFFLISVGFVISFFYCIFHNEVIIVESNKLRRESFFGLHKSEFLFSDVDSYNVSQVASEYVSYEQLDIYFKKGKTRILSYNLKKDEYNHIKNKVTKGKKINSFELAKAEKRSYRTLGGIFFMMGLSFLFMSIKQSEHGKTIVNSKTTTELIGAITQQPEVKNRGGNRSLELELLEYPNFTFRSRGTELKAVNKKVLEEKVNRGDQISIRIWKDTYDKKISKVKQLSFAEKHFDYHNIKIVGITKNGIDFMPASDLNKRRSKFHTKGNDYGLIGIGGFIFFVGIYLLVKSFISTK